MSALCKKTILYALIKMKEAANRGGLEIVQTCFKQVIGICPRQCNHREPSSPFRAGASVLSRPLIAPRLGLLHTVKGGHDKSLRRLTLKRDNPSTAE